MAWTIVKLITLHRTVKPEVLTQPNTLVTAGAAEVSSADTTPDNLYMIGLFLLEPDQTLLLEFVPPGTRYWIVTLENVWHECLEPRHRHSSVTNKGVPPDSAGLLRIAIGAKDFAHAHWLDTAGGERSFVVVRWLDNPAAPALRTARASRSRVMSADRFRPDRLVDQACEEVGLDDFGDPLAPENTWRDGLPEAL